MKTPKGSVAIENHDGRVRLRWSWDGKRFALALGLLFTSVNLKVAQKTANQIELDIISGNFDASLNKYRLNSKKKGLSEKEQKYLLPLWDKWVNTLGLSERTLNGHYRGRN